jgi:hypothetical protein
MRSNEVNKPSGSRWLYTEVQTIEGEIAHAPVSPRKYQSLCKKLHLASQKLQDLEKTSDVFAKAQTEYLKEKVVSLSHDLVERLVEGEVTQIQHESTSLKKGRITPEAIQLLEMHINHLEEHHKPSIPHRRIIADAKHALLDAKEKLEKGQGQPLINHFDWLATQNSVRFVKDEVELLPGEMEELFDIARAVYHRDFRHAKMHYQTLPEDYKRRFEKHMQNLTAKAFDDPLETMQALIATVNELVENGEAYPTSAQIDQLFLGLSQVTEAERMEGKIFSFKSRESLGG